MRCFALVAAAGVGARFGGDVPKQYALLRGAPVLAHAVRRLSEGLVLAEPPRVLLARDDRWFDASVTPGLAVRCGGATRASTVRNGLDSLAGIARDDDWILVHDAARPCVDASSLKRLVDALVDDDVGGLLATRAIATVKRADESGRVLGTESRDRLWLAQTPQMFRYALLRKALAAPAADAYTDEAQAIEALGLRPRLVEGSATNVKITVAEDLVLAAAILAQPA